MCVCVRVCLLQFPVSIIRMVVVVGSLRDICMQASEDVFLAEVRRNMWYPSPSTPILQPSVRISPKGGETTRPLLLATGFVSILAKSRLGGGGQLQHSACQRGLGCVCAGVL